MIRSTLSDALIIINAFIIATADCDEDLLQENVERFCFESLLDSVNHLLREAKEIEDQKEKKKREIWIANNYSRFLEEEKGSSLNVKGGVSRTSKKLAASIKKDKNFESYKDIYNAYSEYSKYDHFGIVYHDFQGQGQKNRIERIKQCINRLFPWLLLCITSILQLHDAKDTHVKHCNDDLFKYLSDQKTS